LRQLATQAEKKGQNNLAFATLFQLGDAKACVDLLAKTQRIPEAALLARTYAPSKIPETVNAWRSDLEGKGRSKLAASIASPTEHGDLFEEGWTEAVERENEGA